MGEGSRHVSDGQEAEPTCGLIADHDAHLLFIAHISEETGGVVEMKMTNINGHLNGLHRSRCAGQAVGQLR